MSRIQKLQKVFSDLDVNGDGRIDRGEFGRLLSHLGVSLGAAEADAAFRHVDRDGNGAIDFDELALWWKFPVGDE